jgi:hypothetical protein
MNVSKELYQPKDNNKPKWIIPPKLNLPLRPDASNDNTCKVSTQPPEPLQVHDSQTGILNPFYKNIKLYIITTFILLLLISVLLYALGILPPQLAIIFSAYSAIVSIIVTGWEQVKPFTALTWQQASHRRAMIILSLITVILSTSIVLSTKAEFFNSTPDIVEQSFTPKPVENHHVSTYIINQQIPMCTPTSGAIWRSTFPQEIRIHCQLSGLEITQVFFPHYAELDLEQPTANAFNQVLSKVEARITFLNPFDSDTWAGIFIQIPQISNIKYVLALNALGQWRIENGVSDGDIPVFAHGKIPLNPTQGTTLKIEVQNGALYLFINQEAIYSYGISDSTHLARLTHNLVGFRVENSETTSSAVLFSNFKLS